ncbi:MAG: hypothetical protein M3O46_17480 [Myxococcota bacterium]|nr:hypothetical protein [Myxococcota bacterium]
MWKKGILAAAATLVANATITTVAGADVTPSHVWAQFPIPGCATSIAVGPNNVPWITGCDAGPDYSIFYLDYHKSENCGIGGCTPSWHQMSGAARYVSVNLNGAPWVVNSAGEVFVSLQDINNPIGFPNGDWKNVTPRMFAQGSCIGNGLAVPKYNAASVTEVFLAPVSENRVPSLWGLGCGSSTDAGIYQLPFGWDDYDNTTTGPTDWQQVGGFASAITFFTDAANNNQTPWVINTRGNVYRFSNGVFVKQHGFGGVFGDAIAITDHFFLLNSRYGQPGVWQWDDTINGLAGNGVPYAPLASPHHFAIKQLAYSAPIVGTSVGTIGPSALWAIDWEGFIYTATLPQGNQ